MNLRNSRLVEIRGHIVFGQNALEPPLRTVRSLLCRTSQTSSSSQPSCRSSISWQRLTGIQKVHTECAPCQGDLLIRRALQEQCPSVYAYRYRYKFICLPMNMYKGIYIYIHIYIAVYDTYLVSCTPVT